MPLHLSIVTPERAVLSQDVDSVTVMTGSGEITILPNHIELLAALKAGEMKLKVAGKEEYLAISTGFLEVKKGGEALVLADTAEKMEELDLVRVEEAKERARQVLLEKHQVDDVGFAAAAAALERELARTKVARRKHLSIHSVPRSTP
ncbi:ATP synthase F1 subunit epsilon [Candidatus Uhrbacteria bacterium]|nr:ATP synthase F1 subunit epsilon [Candidatus Uhrbacteria bacterium]